jgi:hypothetical protein
VVIGQEMTEMKKTKGKHKAGENTRSRFLMLLMGITIWMKHLLYDDKYEGVIVIKRMYDAVCKVMEWLIWRLIVLTDNIAITRSFITTLHLIIVSFYCFY